MSRSSRLPGFYKLPLAERRRQLAAQLGVDASELDALMLDEETANHMIENVVGVYGLPLGIGLNFQINGADFLVPMCVEEPSVIAAASNAAKMVREGGGFTAEADEPIMISQVQLDGVADTVAATQAIDAHAAEIIRRADAAYPSLIGRGGGCRGLEVRTLVRSTAHEPGMLAVHLFIDVRDAMGANLVNTIAEAVAPRLGELAQADIGLRILSNLADRRCVRVTCRVPARCLATDDHTGEVVRDGIVAASRFAEVDPYRAATHNKGIMNGVDAVVMATGNDWRGVEAGAHAYAATKGDNGGYGPLATWRVAADGSGDLVGRIELPLAVGTVGGTLRVHPGARLALKILGTERASELGMVMAATGMASNLAALRALASEGIQKGHMSLHARSLALHVGATGELVDRVAEELSRLGDVRTEVAQQILERLRGTNGHARKVGGLT
ncbi:MAG TPA: hydroxymethylglutaryl-CoA reductase, degradative [Polyangia bacterium]|jgi:hydroxymethylglutaryl-CoA reductase|nr:hydroxymethylglutaryl-CoA reductase, degradative [Polyangia bacterium]